MKPKVMLISTGGTISGGLDPSTGQQKFLGAEALLDLIPEIREEADVQCAEFCRLTSPEITPEIAFSLAKKVNNLFEEDPTLNGVVVTHGTDTLEETAFLLWLLIRDPRPVVLTAAQRSPREDGSDSGRNLSDSIKVACSEEAIGKGVLVCLNHEVNSARYVRKSHTWALQSFTSGKYGVIGYVDMGDVMFFDKPLNHLHIEADAIDSDIDLIKVTQGIGTRYIEASIQEKASAIVVEASGRGFAPPAFLECMHKARRQGIIVVMVSRCFEGRVDPLEKHVKEGIVYGEDLDSLKARILLSLLLPKTREPAIIQRYFEHLSGRSNIGE